MKAWILRNKDTEQYMQKIFYGKPVFTDDINKARIFRRQCDAGNSVAAWRAPYGWRSRQGYNLEKVEVTLDITINITK